MRLEDTETAGNTTNTEFSSKNWCQEGEIGRATMNEKE